MGKILIIDGADFSQVKVDTVVPFQGVTINVLASPVGAGVVAGSGDYAENTQVQITALPNKHYNFKQWDDGNTSPIRTIICSTSETYTAEFESIIDIEGEVLFGQMYFDVSNCSYLKVTYYNVRAIGEGYSAGKSAIRQSPNKPFNGASETVVLVSDFDATGIITSKTFDLQNTTTYPYLAIWVAGIEYDLIVVEKIS